eukprot:gnl/MRDRNA2_/MRDRNA2_81657_c0_seq5.p1 gnl/MRDRNA2_/MRDRNA2_81657_c0~~gnl/MRDRNA2_/MRDRNA2_81657_c0_seq5.p1  ORF type:complete len:721 (+),score=251.65 gnl/MRDRNA2_/MRDRNA2_81657_c0_seq5:77-2164(+)
MVRALLLAVCMGCVSGAKVQIAANPIRKVVTLMQNMQKEVEVELAKEKELYDKFMCFCDAGTSDLQKTAADAKAQNKALTAKYESDTAEKSQLESDIKQHKVDLEAATKDLADATNIRNKEQADYEAESGTKSASEAALGKAIPAIEKGLGGGASFMQSMDGAGALARQIKRAARSSPVLTGGNKAAVLSFLSGQTPGSSEILGMLKAMKDELSRDLATMAKDNAAAVKGFDSMKASKEQEIEFADESIESKKERSGTLAVEIVQAKDGIEDSAAEAAAAEKFAATLIQQCAAKKKEWAVASKARADEIAAIGEAIGILNDDDALDVFKKAIPASLMQSGLGFLQKGGDRSSRIAKAQGLLASGQKYKSAQFGLLLFNVRSKLRLAGKNQVMQFGEIMKMIDGMVEVLGKDAAEDEKQKGWCESEFGKSADEQAAATTVKGQVEAEIAELTDGISELMEAVSTLTKEVAELDKSVADATEQRKEDHAEFTAALQLSEVAVGLIGKAKQRLQKFYNPTLYKAAPKTEMTMEEKIITAGTFAQVHIHKSAVAPPPAPETFGAYEKSTEKSGGVMALMDSITKELEADAKDSEYEEKTAQKEYAELMADSQATRAQDSKSIIDKEAAKATLEEKLMAAKKKHSATTEELSLVATYIGDLHVSCDFIMQNFDLRKEARTAEIESLKNAKAVLAGASYGR